MCMYHVLMPLDRDEQRALAAADAVIGFPGLADQLKVTLLNVQKKVEVDTGDSGRISTDEMYDEDEFPQGSPRNQRLAR